MSSIIKVDNIQNQCGANIIKEDSNTITLGASGDTVALASGASQTGFGRTGTVDWDTTPKTATFSAVSGDGFFCNTTGGVFTCNLPAGSAGAIVSLADYAGTWQTNNLTVSPNGTDKIGGVNEDVVLNTEGQSVTFVYVDSTQGWINVQDSTSNERGENFITATGGTITTSGNFKIHTFTGPGTFTVNCISSTPAYNTISYVVVAGGGGGGGNRGPGGGAGGGGAGAGGYREYKGPTDSYTASPLNGNPGGTAITVTAQGYPIAVGGGGAGGPTGPTGSTVSEGTPGVNSTFSTVTSAGGGGGFWRTGGAAPGGSSGGSGGGGGADDGGTTVAGSGNTPPVSPPQGNNSGTAPGSDPFYGGAGGGGAGAVGSNGSPTAGGAGGAGVTSSITGSPIARSGGGGGGAYMTGTVGSGGSGGGGAGANNGGTSGSGTVNTGGGAGGVGTQSPGTPFGTTGSGGSGIVIIRYKFQ